jgi:site-specific DNA recombinase
MRAVIYARYSSDLQRQSSIDDQLSICSDRGRREDWKIVGNYTDRAASGANILNRPGMRALLADAKCKKFEIVISEALDRISRDQEDIAAIYKRLLHHGIWIFTLAEGKVDELHIGLKGTMNALFLKDLASKIRRGQRGRITSGFSAGGLSYGYQVTRELDVDGQPVAGKRSVKGDEAVVIRRIFTEYASGKSPRRIAAELNADGIPSPRGGQWNASTINGNRGRRNGILQNELYRGQLVYNRVRMLRDPETGKRISRVNPESEWIRTEVPDLRIVSDEVWSSVRQIRRRYAGQPPERARRPKRLLSGLLTCGECSGGFTLVRPGKYGCATHREKGTCSNASQISVDQLERRVLAGIKARLRDPALLTEFVHEFHSELKRIKTSSKDSRSLNKRTFDEITQKIARIVTAIAEGTDTPALRQALVALEGEKAELENASTSPYPTTPAKPPTPLMLAAIFRRKVEELEETLNADSGITSAAAPILRSLIDAIILHPRGSKRRMQIDVYGEPSVLFLPAAGKPADDKNWMITMVAEEGLEPPTRGL